jgi:hypothetical protein
MRDGFKDRIDRMMKENKEVMQWLAEGKLERDSPHAMQYEQHVKETFGKQASLAVMKQLIQVQTDTMISIYYQNMWLTGYLTGVDVVEDKFNLEMPGTFDLELEIANIQAIEIDVFADLQILSGENVNIWLDSFREAPEGYIGTRSVNETIALIRKIEEMRAVIEAIDMENDLGEFARFGGEGIKLLDFLVLEEMFVPILIHTSNPVARRKMERMLERYWPH